VRLTRKLHSFIIVIRIRNSQKIFDRISLALHIGADWGHCTEGTNLEEFDCSIRCWEQRQQQPASNVRISSFLPVPSPLICLLDRTIKTQRSKIAGPMPIIASKAETFLNDLM
jgi:hypothetical protein